MPLTVLSSSVIWGILGGFIQSLQNRRLPDTSTGRARGVKSTCPVTGSQVVFGSSLAKLGKEPSGVVTA